MDVKECYEAFGGNYDECFSRLRTNERITKFLLKMAEDGSFVLLENSLKEGNMPEAFRAAHTLKGVCLNLSVTRLFNSSSHLTEALRGREEYGSDLKPLFDEVKEDYTLFMECIAKLDK